MIGEARVAGSPYMDKSGDECKECVDVKFLSGPWKDKTLNLIRQQISTGKKSFPDRSKY